MEFLQHLLKTATSTLTDVLPIAGIILGFQLLVLRQSIPNLKSVLVGFVYVLTGLTLFLVGLEEALFPLGKLMAQQLTDPEFIRSSVDAAGTTLQSCPTQMLAASYHLPKSSPPASFSTPR